MFALMNPPIRRRKVSVSKTRKNYWPGNADGHSAAAKKGWAKRRKKHGKKIKRASELRTPGGGRIFAVAANGPGSYWPKVRHNSFMGINPYSGNNNPSRSHTMARKRRTRFNMGFSSPKRSGSIFDAFKPNNLVGVTPILAGVILDGMLTKVLSDKIPYTKKGIGNIALGLVGASAIKLLGGYANKQLADGLFVGGVVGTLGCAFQNFMTQGLKSFSLGDMDDLDSFTDHGFAGLGTFVSPGQIQHAIPSGGSMSQYSLPHTNAQFQPMHHAHVAPPHSPAQHHQVHGMSDNDMGAISAVMGQNDEMGM